ncbi:MAG TPA: DNA translocase FtsK 4TM domain-containing protein, partial [Nitrospiria bacterium]|nr:DNA translocase FtsK 4TM domain-containing protein [Nitrospiria bacterium]
PVQNLAGRVGANLSEALFQFAGASAYLLPVFTVLAAWRGLVGKRALWTWRGAGLAALLGLFLSTVTELYLPEGDFYGGGVLGAAMSGLLLGAFAWWGTLIVLTAASLVAVLALFPWSLREGAGRTGSLLSSLVNRVRGMFVIRRGRTRRKQAAPTVRQADAPPQPPPRIAEAPEPTPAPQRQESLAFMRGHANYQLPPLSLLADAPSVSRKAGKDDLVMSSRLLEKKLQDFGVQGAVTEVHPGPVITMYEVELEPGVKVSKVLNLADDLALAMKAPSVRIVTPLPGKSAIGIEIPNQVRETVALKEIVSATEFLDTPGRLPLALGKDTVGQPVVADLAAMPHLLVAGATGSGKSVALNTMILSLLSAGGPRDIRMLMIDPKMLELSAYDAIPHLLAPVITQPKDASAALKRVVAEMQRRYRLLAEAGVRNIDGYNKQVESTPIPPASEVASSKSGVEVSVTAAPPERLPYIVVIIDELADLMLVAAREVEDSIMRLAQMARAAGIHLILATQRPSVDVLTGVIKANFPARISFQVSSKTDSRTILDANGAEQLLGRGDMLYLMPGTGRIARIHGAFVSDVEIASTVEFVKAQGPPGYEWSLEEADASGFRGGEDPERDDLYEKAIDLVATTGQASASFIQRRMRVGYPRAARMIEMMEEDQIIGPASGGKPREVLVRRAVPGEAEA